MQETCPVAGPSRQGEPSQLTDVARAYELKESSENAPECIFLALTFCAPGFEALESWSGASEQLPLLVEVSHQKS